MRIARALMILMALIGSSSAARSTQYELRSCAPGSVDGSQVFIAAFLDGKCNGAPKVTLYVIDYVAQAICSVRANTCVGLTDMSSDQRDFYVRHQEYRRHTVPEPRTCTQKLGEYGTFVMITGGGAPCDPKYNGARSYDPVLRQICVHLGLKTVGCVATKE